MEKLQLAVGMVQINNSFSGQNYLPYSVACLQSYFEEHSENPERYCFLEPIYKRQPIDSIVDHLIAADVVGFSLYVWNANISLEIARRLKKKKPSIIIVVGGPQVPDKPEEFLRANPQLDMAFHNEAEISFTRFLDAYPDKDWRSIAGTSQITPDGAYLYNPLVARIRELDEIPSPFLNGYFDRLMAAHPEESWIGLWETNRGCPFKCSYCDWGSATAAKVTKFGVDRLVQEADWFSERKIAYVFVCDANFGMIARDLDIVRRVAENRKRTGYPEGFSVQNTKNATERAYQTQKILSDAGLNKGVALSIQTLSQEALVNIRRDNISLETYLELQRRFTRDGVETYSDIILGLPGETYDSFVDGINQLLESGQHNRIQFNNCAILPNAEMGQPDYLQKYSIKTVQTDIVNIHGHKLKMVDDVEERQELIISTYSMSAEDWRRCRAIAWMSALLHFDKILQIPLIVIHHLCGVSYADMFRMFMDVDRSRYPLLGEIRDFFISEAAGIQAGGTEYTYAPDWLGIYWPADEYVFIKMTAEKSLDRFYEEAKSLLLPLVAAHPAEDGMEEIVGEAFMINRRLVHQPFLTQDEHVDMAYSVIDFYNGVVKGVPVPLERRPNRVHIRRSHRPYTDFQLWCREIVWWGNKKGAYLTLNTSEGRELAGHY
ncbi:radical SAM protein [Azospirillum largimobile]